MNEVNNLLNRLGELDDAPLIWVNKKVYDMAEEIEILNTNLEVANEDLTRIAQLLNLEEGCTIYDIEDKIERLNKRIEDLNIINEEHQILNGMIRKELQEKENIIKEVREYITSYESISTIQGIEGIGTNKDLDEKTLTEMVRRYMTVHDKLLEILDKVGSDKE